MHLALLHLQMPMHASMQRQHQLHKYARSVREAQGVTLRLPNQGCASQGRTAHTHLYLLASVAEDTLKKVQPHSVATALASMVLPVPGGPNSITPCAASTHESMSNYFLCITWATACTCCCMRIAALIQSPVRSQQNDPWPMHGCCAAPCSCCAVLCIAVASAHFRDR